MIIRLNLIAAALVSAATALAATAADAQVSGDVVRVGVINDMSGLYSDLGGEGSVAAAKLADAGNPAAFVSPVKAVVSVMVIVPTSSRHRRGRFGTLPVSLPRGEMSLYSERVIRFAARSFLEHDQQRKHGKHRDHQQLVVVYVGNDLRLLRDHGIECGASSGSQGIPELCNRRVVERPVHRRNVLHNVGMIDLRVARQQSVHDRDADAGADVPRETV
jgi:hypothetical protein